MALDIQEQAVVKLEQSMAIPIHSGLEDLEAILQYSKKSCESVLERVIRCFNHQKALIKDRVIFTAGPKSQFCDQVWTRDISLAIINVFAQRNPVEALNTLDLIFKYQRYDGALPLRVEGIRLWIYYMPILGRIKYFVNRKNPRPVYTNRFYSTVPRDTIPMAILACHEVFPDIIKDEKFALERWKQMVKAIQKEESLEREGLVWGINFQDWVDSIDRKGKLSNVNILFYQALKSMSQIAKSLGKDRESRNYAKKAADYKERIMYTFWSEEGYFKAGDIDDRFDTFSNIIGSLYIATPSQAVKIQDNLKEKVIAQNGLLNNFDKPYSNDFVATLIRIGNMEGYHNKYSWPWVTCMNIVAKLKIARDHDDKTIKERFKKEALGDFAKVSAVFKDNKGVYEIVDDITQFPIHERFNFWLFSITAYKSSPEFLNSAAAYMKVLNELTSMGLIEPDK